MMATGIHINRWTHYIRDMFRVLRGGGWCQLVEVGIEQWNIYISVSKSIRCTRFKDRVLGYLVPIQVG